MEKPIGGRGKAAPYKSTHVRIPEPIKSRVEDLKQLFFTYGIDQHDKFVSDSQNLVDNYQNDLTADKNDSVDSDFNTLNKEQIISLAKEILKQKKSAKISIAKLLTGLLSEEIKVEDLQ